MRRCATSAWIPACSGTVFRGRDLTMFANHLFDGHSLVAWAYAEEPHSIIWVVRDDGVLLAHARRRPTSDGMGPA